MQIRFTAAIAAVATSVMVALNAQQPGPEPGPRRFEAASVKRNNSGTDNSTRNLGGGGRMVFVNYSVHELITAAYDLQAFQVIGGPAWIGRDRFDVMATAGTNAPLPELNLMLRSLLADRFALAVRHEMRELPRYRLVKARDDGRPGPGLKRSMADCGPSGRGANPGCRAWISPAGVDFGGQSIAELARVLAMLLDRPVIDETGLTGGYDIALSFTTEARFAGGDATGNPNTPSVFTALREQLGLALEANRGAVEVVIVERVSPPSEN